MNDTLSRKMNRVYDTQCLFYQHEIRFIKPDGTPHAKVHPAGFHWLTMGAGLPLTNVWLSENGHFLNWESLTGRSKREFSQFKPQVRELPVVEQTANSLEPFVFGSKGSDGVGEKGDRCISRTTMHDTRTFSRTDTNPHIVTYACAHTNSSTSTSPPTRTNTQ